MKCDNCGKEVDGDVCRNCGLVIDDRPIAHGGNGYPRKKIDITTLYAAEIYGWEHPLSPKIRKMSKSFNPKYQKKYEDYVYVKAYESISKICATLMVPKAVKFEALNLFKGIRGLDISFFRSYKLAPTYLACIKIACKMHDFPISNHDLANSIDYEIDDDSKKNFGYMEKKFNNAYRGIIKLYKLSLRQPEHPNFIDYVCNKLNTKYEFTFEIHKKYTTLYKFFQSHFRTEGYILALIYIYGREEYGLTLKQLEEIFHISALTITSRKNEIINIIKKIEESNADKGV